MEKFDRQTFVTSTEKKMVREKSRECHNHKPQPFPDTQTTRYSSKPNKLRNVNIIRKDTRNVVIPKREINNIKIKIIGLL